MGLSKRRVLIALAGVSTAGATSSWCFIRFVKALVREKLSISGERDVDCVRTAAVA